MAQAVKVGGFIYRINPDDDRQLQRANVVSVKTGACEEQYAFGELADLPDPEPEEEETAGAETE